MRIFFTGGSGKAGQYVAPHLASLGHQVTNADLVPLGHDDVTDLKVDLTDQGQVYSAMAGVPTQADFDDTGLDLTHGSAYDAVVHFAAIPRPLLMSTGWSLVDGHVERLAVALAEADAVGGLRGGEDDLQDAEPDPARSQ